MNIDECNHCHNRRSLTISLGGALAGTEPGKGKTRSEAMPVLVSAVVDAPDPILSWV